jgi:hypothetical protein
MSGDILRSRGESSVRRIFPILLSFILAFSLSGCLGTLVRTPTPEGKPVPTTHVHILAAPFRIDAHMCRNGISRVEIYVPLLGVAVGILTFGILVPKTAVYSCVETGR